MRCTKLFDHEIEFAGRICYVSDYELYDFKKACELAGDDALEIQDIHIEYAALHKVGGFVFNHNGVCLNPDEAVSVSIRKNVYAQITVAKIKEAPERWVYGYMLSHFGGDEGGGASVGCDLDDREVYPTLRSAAYNGVQRVLDSLSKCQYTEKQLKENVGKLIYNLNLHAEMLKKAVGIDTTPVANDKGQFELIFAD